MPEENNKQDISIETPIGKLAAKGVRVSDMIGIITMIGVAAMLYLSLKTVDVMGEHKIETKHAMESVASSIKENARAGRLMTCIISMPQERREQEFTQLNSFCQRMANLP